MLPYTYHRITDRARRSMDDKPSKIRFTKQQELLATLRGEIVQGVFAAGDRMPTRVELEERLGVSWFTIQQAFDALRREGFIRTDGRRGTFVVETPPHLHRYALIFPRHGDGIHGQSRFYEAFSNAAEQIQQEKSHIDWAVFNLHDRTDEKDYNELLNQINTHRLAGLIFIMSPFRLSQTPIIQMPGISRVMIASQSSNNIPAIWMDYRALIEMAVNKLVASGRSRLSLIMARMAPDHIRMFKEAVEKQGAQTSNAWIQVLHESHKAMAGNLIELLMNPNQKQRPDGMIILDDNLVEHVTIAMMDAGLRVKEDLDIVAYSNFPLPAVSAFPVYRMGFDSRQLLENCLAAIDGQNANQTSNFQTLIKPVSEPEIPV